MAAILIESITKDFGSKLLAIIAAILVCQIILFIFKRRHKHKTFERMSINGPKPNFIHGNLYETRREAYVKFAHKMHEKYGKNVGMYLGGDPYLMTKDLDLIQQVFVANSRIFFDRMNFYLNVDPVPDNLICQRGDRWRYMRKLLTPAFSNSKIKSSYFYRDAQQTVRKFMKQLEDNSNDEITIVDDLYDRMAAVALDVIVKTAFHMDNMISFSGPLDQTNNSQQARKLAADDFKQAKRNSINQSSSGMNNSRLFVHKYAHKDNFLNTVKLACRLAFNPLVELIFCFPFLDVPLTFLCNQLYFGSIIKLLFDRLDYLIRRNSTTDYNTNTNTIQAKKGLPIVSCPQETNQHRRRIVDSLIEVLREKKITKSEFTGNAFVIVFAGFETTANALTFTLWLLAKHERVQNKLREELRLQMFKLAKKNQSQTEGDMSTEELDDLELTELAYGCEYLEMVINESLRLYPPVPGLSCRQASIDCKLSNGLKIEKGVNIIPSVFSIHREKTIWGNDANKFIPERFDLLDINQLNSAMFMPFGLGPRNCIGKAAAMHELKIVVGRLILEYSILPEAGRTPDKLKLCSPINITITSADKISMKFVKLNNK